SRRSDLAYRPVRGATKAPDAEPLSNTETSTEAVSDPEPPALGYVADTTAVPGWSRWAVPATSKSSPSLTITMPGADDDHVARPFTLRANPLSKTARAFSCPARARAPVLPATGTRYPGRRCPNRRRR